MCSAIFHMPQQNTFFPSNHSAETPTSSAFAKRLKGYPGYTVGGDFFIVIPTAPPPYASDSNRLPAMNHQIALYGKSRRLKRCVY